MSVFDQYRSKGSKASFVDRVSLSQVKWREEDEKQQKQRKQTEDKQRQDNEIKQAQEQKKKKAEENTWLNKGIRGVQKAFSLEGAQRVAKDVKEQLVDAPIEAARNAIAQAQMGQRGAGDERSKKLIESRNKWADEDLKAGKITKQQRDKMVAENNKRLQKTQETTKKLEKEFGRKYNQDQGAIDAVSTITGFEAAPAIIKGAAKAGGSLLTKMSSKGAKAGAKEDVAQIVDDAAKAREPKKVPVISESLGTEKVGVTTPIKPGIRQESTTYSVQPRVPQKVSSEIYTKKFNKISKEYDKEVKQLEKKPSLTQESGMQQIDEKYKAKIEQLDAEFEKGVLPNKTVLTKVDKTTSKAEPTTGGAPTEGVNVRSSLYKPESKKLRVSGDEATQKLAKAGYTTDESKEILADALSKRGLSMPGSPKKVGYDEQSIIESARNYDGEAVTLPDLKPPRPSGDEIKGTSRLGQSVLSEAQKSKLISKAELESADLPQYTKANMKDQAKYANELIKSSPDDAIEIAMGRKAPPEHILPQIVFNAVEAHAKAIGGDDGAQLLRELARSKQVTNLSTMAQNVRAAAERDPHSPVTLMNDVKLSRMEKLKRGGKSVSKEQKADAKVIKKETPKVKKEDWDSFVKGITC